MRTIDRRKFLGGALATGSVLASNALISEPHAQEPVQQATPHGESVPAAAVSEHITPIDFRYSPVIRQTAFCFPDDSHKSLVNQKGDLLYDFAGGSSLTDFPLMAGFVLNGMHSSKVLSQELESPTIPIVRTAHEYPGISMMLTTFATNDGAEGRVDNVIVDVTPNSGGTVNIEPLIELVTTDKFDVVEKDGVLSMLHRDSREVLLVGRVPAHASEHGTTFGMDFSGQSRRSQRIKLGHGQASKSTPYRAFFRFPQAKQETTTIVAGLADPERCLESCRSFWKSWSAFRQPVAWEIPGRRGEFVEACARNILQAREVVNDKLTFQVGPTRYRGLWVVDGNFILEAARYLGYDKDAEEGLRTTWSKQQDSGQIVARGGGNHWKDTAIAMFTLVRQCELSQDWTLLRELEPQVVHAIGFLRSLQASATKENSALGRYGLLPKGFADGGVGGIRDEFTNTVWVLAGLKAIADVAERQKIESLSDAREFSNQLEAAFLKAAQREMRSYEGKFDYLPMVLKDDPEWELPDPWDRPRPQSAQWALSHSIFPGRVFDAQHPIVRGHVQLMQAIAKEDIPAETGWLPHEAVWTYNAPFVAEIYLWLGMKQAAHDTFTGFLNHASPQYCWREEQPLQNALIGSYVGDMPHNWASAECIRYIRHILALEDGANLRLLAGITEGELSAGKPYALRGTPTRFGRLDLNLEPLDKGQRWRLSVHRDKGPDPVSISVPAVLGGNLQLTRAEGVQLKRSGDTVTIDPTSRQWSLTWKA